MVPRHNYVVAAAGGIADYYQTAVAMAERRRLATLVTDVYAPDLIANQRHAPRKIMDLARKRHAPGLSSHSVSASLRQELIARAKSLISSSGSDVHERIGLRAAREVRARDCGAIIYFNHWPYFAREFARTRPKSPLLLVQYHPVMSQVRQALRVDRELTGISDGIEYEEQIEPEYISAYEKSLRSADGVIAASSFVKEGLVSIGVEPERIRVVPYGGVPSDPRFPLESEVFVPAAEPCRDGSLRLLWVGSLVYRKGAHHLAEALRQLSDYKITLTIVSRSCRVADPFKGIPGVHHVGEVSVDSLDKMYRAHDLLCLPSLAEGFGMVIAEALGNGLPVLATTATGARDIVSDGINGMLVPPGDADALTIAIRSVAADHHVLACLRAGARSTAALRTWSSFRSSISQAVAELETIDLRVGGLSSI